MVCEGDWFGRSMCMLPVLKNASCDIQISRNSRVDGLRGRLVRKVNVHVACLEKR